MCQVGDIYVECLVSGFYCYEIDSMVIEKVEREWLVVEVMPESNTFKGYWNGVHKIFYSDLDKNVE